MCIRDRDQIVFRVVDLEIGVTLDVVVQEPHGQLRRQRKAALGQGIDLRLGQRGSGIFQKAVGKGFKYLQIHSSLLRLGAILLHEVGSRPRCV